MSRVEHALEGAQAVIPDDRVIDVALVMPRGSTMAGMIGAAAGAGVGNALGNSTAWGIAGVFVGQRVRSNAKGTHPSIVLAVSSTKLYVLGRHRTGLVGGWKDLEPVAHIERVNLSVARSRHGTVPIIALTDQTTGTTLEFEGMHIGGMGLDELLETLESD